MNDIINEFTKIYKSQDQDDNISLNDMNQELLVFLLMGISMIIFMKSTLLGIIFPIMIVLDIFVTIRCPMKMSNHVIIILKRYYQNRNKNILMKLNSLGKFKEMLLSNLVTNYSILISFLIELVANSFIIILGLFIMNNAQYHLFAISSSIISLIFIFEIVILKIKEKKNE